MTIPSALPLPPGAAPAGSQAKSPEEAAKQFETVLVRQFVEVMTRSLFESDDEGPMTGQADLQRDVMTDTLTERLVESGSFGVAELLMRQWTRTGQAPASSDSTPDARPSNGLLGHQPTTQPAWRPMPDATPAPRSVQPTEPRSTEPRPSQAPAVTLPPYSRPSVPAAHPAEAPARPRGRASTLEDALRMYPGPQGRPISTDNTPQTP